LSAFEILLPIAYTLMLAGVIAWLVRSRVAQVVLIGTVFSICCLWTSAPFNLRFTAIGLNGMAIGHLSYSQFGDRTRRIALVILLCLVAGYMLSISLVAHDNLLIYFLGVFSVVQL